MHDRTYYRLCDMRVLIEAARDSGHELAIVLGEKLDDYWHEFEDVAGLRESLREMENSRNMWMREAMTAIDAISAMPELGREVIKQNQE